MKESWPNNNNVGVAKQVEKKTGSQEDQAERERILESIASAQAYKESNHTRIENIRAQQAVLMGHEPSEWRDQQIQACTDGIDKARSALRENDKSIEKYQQQLADMDISRAA